MAPMMHKYARDAKTALDALGAGDSTEWIDFLFWDPAAPESHGLFEPSSLLPGSGYGWSHGAFGLVDQRDVHVIHVGPIHQQSGRRS